MGKNILHFLHIRKTGGTAIKEALRDVVETEKYFIRLHSHKTRLIDIPKNEKVFFFLRDPIARFVSGFNSRLRQGKPRYNSPWNEGEKIAFQHFPTANKLAETLFETHQQKIVEQAMADIRHINQTYAYWFDNIEYISSRIKDLIFVGFQETFNSDFERLKKLIQLPKYIHIPQDDIKSHRTPKNYDTFLSDKSVVNLKKWYSQDYEFIGFFKNYKNPIVDQEPADLSILYGKKTDHSNLPKPDSEIHPLLPMNRDSDDLIKRIQYWNPPVPNWQPLKKTLNSSLRMACVVEDRLYHGLRFEGEVMLLTPANWKHVFKYGQPDFLLMESIWSSATGHWHMGQSPNAPGRNELLEIVALAGKLSIPSVFWITRGHEYHEHYKDFASHFDHVFCADTSEVELLRAEGINAKELLPCVQPAIYNPFRHYEDYNAFSLGILYDGWADLDRMTEELKVLQELRPFGLDIIESRYQIFRNRMMALPVYKECILGCVSKQSRMQALRYAKAYLTLEKTLSTKTTQQWMTLEAAASRLPVVHHGSLKDGDVRKNIVIECPKQMDFLVEFVRFREDELYRKRLAHLGWRKTFEQHTFSHRIQKICKTIGTRHDWEEYPKASLVTPTFRRELLTRCFQSFVEQTYPNKELVLIFNGSEMPSCSQLGLEKLRNDVKILNVPGEMFAGACLNAGNMLAEGKYCFRVDDDDHYGSNYILDMILLARSIDADLFGKPPVPVNFENSPIVYIRNKIPELCVIKKGARYSGALWLGGNSIGGQKSFFLNFAYKDDAYGAADSSFIYNLNNYIKKQEIICATMDGLNLVAGRTVDQDNHTWKIDAEKFKRRCSKSYQLRDMFV